MFGGWVTGGKAKEMAQQQADKAVTAALSPICVDKFRHATNADENLGKLKAISYSWEKGTYVSAGGWATLARQRRAELGGGASLCRSAEHRGEIAGARSATDALSATGGERARASHLIAS